MYTQSSPWVRAAGGTIKGKAQETVGSAKRGIGEATDNADMQASGMADKAKGQGNQAKGEVEETASDIEETVKDKTNEALAPRETTPRPGGTSVVLAGSFIHQEAAMAEQQQQDAAAHTGKYGDDPGAGALPDDALQDGKTRAERKQDADLTSGEEPPG